MNFLLLSLFFFLSLAKERHYFLQAEEINWDYAPGLHPHTKHEKIYLRQSDDRIGKVYKKCVYRRYTDSSFSKRHHADDRSSGSKWEHLGFLGPVLRGVIGDKIYIHFKNTCEHPATVHVHGLQYSKKYEGSNYEDFHFHGGSVSNGDSFTYEYDILKRSGPSKNDPSTISWLYHSHVDEPIDTNTGLVGVFIVGKDEEHAEDGVPRGVDREFVTHYSILDENLSRYINDNIRKYTEVRGKEDVKHLKKNLLFLESNRMNAINGYVFFTLPGIEMNIGEKVRWYVTGLGGDVDIHTVHWHGNTAVVGGSRVDVVDISPGVTLVADMKPDIEGVWMVHCHVNDHIDAGMLGVYTVNGNYYQNDNNEYYDDNQNDYQKGDDHSGNDYKKGDDHNGDDYKGGH